MNFNKKGKKITFVEEIYFIPITKSSYVLTKKNLEGFEKGSEITAKMFEQRQMVIEPIDDSKIFYLLKPAVKGLSTSGNRNNLKCFVTENRHIRFQTAQLKPLMKQYDRNSGYFVFHIVKGKRNYIEVSFKANVEPYIRKNTKSYIYKQEYFDYMTTIQNMGLYTHNVVEQKELNFSFSATPVMNNDFVLPLIFPQIKKGMQLKWQYSENGDKIIISIPEEVCSICGKKINAYSEDAEEGYICGCCSDTLIKVSSDLIQRIGDYKTRFNEIKSLKQKEIEKIEAMNARLRKELKK